MSIIGIFFAIQVAIFGFFLCLFKGAAGIITGIVKFIRSLRGEDF